MSDYDDCVEEIEETCKDDGMDDEQAHEMAHTVWGAEFGSNN